MSLNYLADGYCQIRNGQKVSFLVHRYLPLDVTILTPGNAISPSSKIPIPPFLNHHYYDANAAEGKTL